MDSNYGSDFISVSDDDGNEYQLEHLDTIEINGEFYLAFLPADLDEDDENYGLLILKSEDEPNGDQSLVVPPDEELIMAYEKFMERLFADDDYESIPMDQLIDDDDE